MVIIGIDEVGRGCWAGPVVAAAVALDSDFMVPVDASWKLNDSKALTKKQRLLADAELQLVSLDMGIGWVDAATIDRIGLNKAVGWAMGRAMDQIKIDYDKVIIDGNINFLPENPKAETLIKADSLVPAVSAASIIAKVARDKYMEQISIKYPNYGFEKHVGYGTAFHLDNLKLHGVSNLHRKSFKPIQVLIEAEA